MKLATKDLMCHSESVMYIPRSFTSFRMTRTLLGVSGSITPESPRVFYVSFRAFAVHTEILHFVQDDTYVTWCFGSITPESPRVFYVSFRAFAVHTEILHFVQDDTYVTWCFGSKTPESPRVFLCVIQSFCCI